MKGRLIILLAVASFLLPVQVYASDNDILDKIKEEQQSQEEAWLKQVQEVEDYGIPGDRCNLLRSQVTCYIEPGRKTATGCNKMNGIIASAPEYLGYVAQVYKVAEDGGIGEFIGYYQVEDTGYGAPSGYGKSIYKGKKSAGTIELGLTYDFRQPDYAHAKKFMIETYTGNGTTYSEVYISLINGNG